MHDNTESSAPENASRVPAQKRPAERSGDEPLHSRLFVVCSRSHTHEELESAFSKYGLIEDIFLVKDRATGESKGTLFVKYDKTSSAALAQESLNDTIVGTDPRPLRVMIAEQRNRQQGYDVNDEKHRNRLFVILPKGSGEAELKDAFCNFEGFEGCYLVRDKATNEPKGYGYVNFTKPSLAALAKENCDSKLCTMIAEPKEARQPRGGQLAPRATSFGRRPAEMREESGRFDGDGNFTNRLYVIVDPSVTNDQLAALCDLAPGLEHCEVKYTHGTRDSRGFAFVTYTTADHARYARGRLNCIEYPQGTRLVAKYADNKRDGDERGREEPLAQRRSYHDAPRTARDSRPPPPAYRTEPPPREGPGQYHMSRESRAPREYHDAEQYQGHSRPAVKSDYYGDGQDLYRPSSAADARQSPAAQAPLITRLFFSASPVAPSEVALDTVFSRFGGFIDIYTISGQNYGYARYTSFEAAQRAIDHIDGALIDGKRMKVVLADPPRGSNVAEPSPRRAYAD